MKWLIIAVWVSATGESKEIILQPSFTSKAQCETALLVMKSGLITDKVSLKCKLEGEEEA